VHDGAFDHAFEFHAGIGELFGQFGLDTCGDKALAAIGQWLLELAFNDAGADADGLDLARPHMLNELAVWHGLDL
jgi:hypothetical protein